MKKLALITFSAILATVGAYATSYMGPTNLSKETLKEVIIHGPAQLQQIKADSLQVMGPLEFKDLQVAGNTTVIGAVSNSQSGKFNELKITGPFKVKQVEANTLQVIGQVDVDGIAVKGETVVFGPLAARNSKFQNITITTDKITLDNVSVNNIYVKQSNTKTPPTITLSGKTVVAGSIQFESKNGIVSKGKSAEIKGAINGGEVKK